MLLPKGPGDIGVTFSEQTEWAPKNYAASADVMKEAFAFFESNRSAIDRSLKAYQAAQASGLVEEALPGSCPAKEAGSSSQPLPKYTRWGLLQGPLVC